MRLDASTVEKSQGFSSQGCLFWKLDSATTLSKSRPWMLLCPRNLKALLPLLRRAKGVSQPYMTQRRSPTALPAALDPYISSESWQIFSTCTLLPSSETGKRVLQCTSQQLQGPFLRLGTQSPRFQYWIELNAKIQSIQSTESLLAWQFNQYRSSSWIELIDKYWNF